MKVKGPLFLRVTIKCTEETRTGKGASGVFANLNDWLYWGFGVDYAIALIVNPRESHY